jgi:hypothetical protein
MQSYLPGASITIGCQAIFNGIETFVSSEDIRKGKGWPIEVSKEL